VRSKANARLAKDAVVRNSPREAVRYYESYANDCPDDRKVLLRLLELRTAGLGGSERSRLFAELRERFPVLRDDIVEAAFVLTYTDPDRALRVLDDKVQSVLRERALGLQAVDGFIEAEVPAHAYYLAEKMFEAEGAGKRELSCMLRAEKANGRPAAASLVRFEKHLARFPDDHENRCKKAKLLFQLRRWEAVCEEALIIRRSLPMHIRAAELEILALIRLDRPSAARAVRDELAACYDEASAPDSLVSLDLALADGQAALDRSASSGTAGDASAMRINVLMATGHYREALQTIEDLLPRSDDPMLRTNGLQCAAALASVGKADRPFPEAAFRAAIGLRRRPPPGDKRSIVLVTSTLGAGGAERQVALTAAKLSAPLAAVGLDVHLVCRDLRQEHGHRVMLPMLDGSGANVIDLSEVDAGGIVRSLRAKGEFSREDIQLLSAFPLPLYRTIILLYHQFRVLNPRVVYLWQDGIICAGGVAALLAGVPRVVGSLRNVVPLEDDTRRRRTYLRGVYRAMVKRPEVHLVANSWMGARDYEEKFDLVPRSIGVIRNALDVDALQRRAGGDGGAGVRAQLGLSEDELVLGAVFRLVPAKRPHRWLDVAARVAAEIPNLRMLIIGDGPLRNELADYAEKIGIGRQTVFAGRQSPVEPWIAAMDTMLLSSDVEGLPNVLLEAQALGVPVVTTDAGGAREALEHETTGLLVKEGGTTSLAASCVRMLTDEQLRRLARARAPIFVAQQFGVDRMVRETLDWLGLSECLNAPDAVAVVKKLRSRTF
jgi:glycosyltransferase involved in cell wall biosynthesis